MCIVVCCVKCIHDTITSFVCMNCVKEAPYKEPEPWGRQTPTKQHRKYLYQPDFSCNFTPITQLSIYTQLKCIPAQILSAHPDKPFLSIYICICVANLMSHMSLHKAIFWPNLVARAAKYHEQWFPSSASHISRRMCHET